MTATLDVARDEILALFNDAWTAGTAPLNAGTPYEVRWDGVDEQDKPQTSAPWAMARVQHLNSSQRTLADSVGQRRFTRIGFVSIDLFIPLARGDVSTTWETLATIVRDAFEGVATTSAVWFRNVRTLEDGPDEGFYRGSIIADFEYDEHR